jgi:uncharacterized protein YyaL (SSP411 family)
MLKGLCDAYRAFNKTEYLELALKNAEFITDNLLSGAKLSRVYKKDDSHSKGEGRGEAVATFLDDYANVINGFYCLVRSDF